MTLFINACVRQKSRTKELADCLLSKSGHPYEEVRLDTIDFPFVNESFLEKRDRLIQEQDFNNPLFDLARQFAAAEDIIIAAPYWDLSFPATLKQYFEQINVVGITFVYTPEGIPAGLCKARSLTYIMTAGGYFVPEEYGPGYVRSLAQNFYGIPEFKLIKAIGLDVDGADIDSIMNADQIDCEECIMDREQITALFEKYCKKLRIVPAWDVKLELVDDPSWPKTGDFRIDCDDRKAILMLNIINPKQENMEEVIIHELMHLKMYPLDQVTESLILSTFPEESPAQDFAYRQFYTTLEQTVEELAKCFLLEFGDNKTFSYGRCDKMKSFNDLYDGLNNME